MDIVKEVIERIKYDGKATQGNSKSAVDCGLYNVKVKDAVGDYYEE